MFCVVTMGETGRSAAVYEITSNECIHNIYKVYVYPIEIF